MELRTLRYFIAVLEAGSLSRAAGSLYVAQPALTAQIKKLEAELGAQLFEQGGRVNLLGADAYVRGFTREMDVTEAMMKRVGLTPM